MPRTETRGIAEVAVVLAAGYSSRMGALKPLLEIDGKPAIRRLLDSITQAGIQTTIVVTGWRAEEIEQCADCSRVVVVRNENFASGMYSSILAGIRQAKILNAKNILLFPVDAPLVSSGAIRAVISAGTSATNYPFAVACYHGKKGHPLWIPGKYFDDILAHDDAGGLGVFTRRFDEHFLYVETDDEGTVLDMDTPEAYEELLAFSRARRGVSELLRTCPLRLFLVRHGSIVPQREKILLGQTDVPLSERGREDARAAAKELATLDLHPTRIYTSDLTRAKETAQIVAETFPGIPIVADAGFREIDLADWDGRFIPELMAAYPEEYEKRGRNILCYKRPGGENFYDLRYRVMRTLLKLPESGTQLESETHEMNCTQEISDRATPMDDTAKNVSTSDVVLITHAGVIRALLSELKDIPAEEAWSLEIPRGSVTAVSL